MGTIAISGSASGIGAATRRMLEDDGHTVIGIDLRDAEVTADLSTDDGREAAVGVPTHGRSNFSFRGSASPGGSPTATKAAELRTSGRSSLTHRPRSQRRTAA